MNLRIHKVNSWFVRNFQFQTLRNTCPFRNPKISFTYPLLNRGMVFLTYKMKPKKAVFCYFAPWYSFYTPLDIGYVFALIQKKNLKFDLHAIRLGYHEKKYTEKIMKLKPDAVFFFLDNIIWSGAYGYLAALETAKKLRTINPNMKIGFQSYKIQDSEIKKALDTVDFVVSGSDLPFHELDVLLTQKGTIKGKHIDINTLPSPYLVGIFDKHLETMKSENLSAFIQTSTGCMYGCDYCHRSVKFESVQNFPVKRVYDEIEYIVDKGINNFFIIDDCFLTTKERLMEFLVEFKNRKFGNISLSVMCRPDIITEEIVSIFTKLNIVHVQMGIQTTNPKLQDYMKRKTKPDYTKIAGWFRKYGISIQVDVIWGLPDDDIESFKRSLDTALKLHPRAVQVKQLYLNPNTVFDLDKEKYQIKTAKLRYIGVPFVSTARGIDKKYKQEAFAYVERVKQKHPEINWRWVSENSSWHDEF